MTFWVFVFWFLLEKGDHPVAPVDQATPQKGWPRQLILVAAVLIAVHAGATVVDAFGDLRPRERAQRWGWFCRYGFLSIRDWTWE